MSYQIITIDGPAGSGKSTLARYIARALGYYYLNTGAMYRAVTLEVLRTKKDPHNETICTEIAKGMDFSISRKNDITVLLCNGKPLSAEIQSEIVDKNVSFVSRHPGVRDIMAEKQRDLGQTGSLVAEGRDAGTRVFPQASAKLYVTASLEKRAERRYQEYLQKGLDGLDLEVIRNDLKKRDEIDSRRKHSPLAAASDAVILDTTNLTREEQFVKALDIVRERGIDQE